MAEHSLGKGEVEGSSPSISSRFREGDSFASGKADLLTRSELTRCFLRGSNSVVESQPSKLLVAGSIPVSRSKV